MITVIISNDNQHLIADILPGVLFQEEPDNECSFRIIKPEFQALYATVKGKGYNPFSVMKWQQEKRKSSGKVLLFVMEEKKLDKPATIAQVKRLNPQR